MTVDNEAETHPLDRDYSLPAQPRSPTAVAYYPKLRRVGLITFGAGFVTVFLAAIVLGNFRGGGGIETIGSSIHRLAMIIILVGGILVILAYRLADLKARPRATRREARRKDWQSFLLLVVWNVAGFFAIVLVAHLCRSIVSQALFFVVNAAFSITVALLVTMAVWHRGFVRAYAVGVLVALLMNSFTSFVTFNWMRGESLPLLAHLVTIQVSGLTCAGYVCLMKPASLRKSSVREESPYP